VRSYAGWTQAAANADFGDRIEDSDFSIFLEAIFHRNNSPIWQWLEWNEDSKFFVNTQRFGTMLELLKDDSDGDPRIARVNPDLRDKFSRLVLPGNEPILNEFLSGQRTLDQAVAALQVGDAGGSLVDLDIHKARLVDLNERLATLPLPAIVAEGRQHEFRVELDQIAEYAARQSGYLASDEVTGAASPVAPDSDVN
jgi:hypothetical protein